MTPGWTPGPDRLRLSAGPASLPFPVPPPLPCLALSSSTRRDRRPTRAPRCSLSSRPECASTAATSEPARAAMAARPTAAARDTGQRRGARSRDRGFETTRGHRRREETGDRGYGDTEMPAGTRERSYGDTGSSAAAAGFCGRWRALRMMGNLWRPLCLLGGHTSGYWASVTAWDTSGHWRSVTVGGQ